MPATAALLWWPTHQPGFEARWVAMPPSLNHETYRAARKAAARPSYCMWSGPDTACRVELVLKSVCGLGAGRNPGPIFIPSAIAPATSPRRNRKQFGRTLSDESDSSQGFQQSFSGLTI